MLFNTNVSLMRYIMKSINKYHLGLALFSAVALTFSVAQDAQAGRYKLKCKGAYQVVDGNLISTPPCQNANLARVARGYGYKVSARQISNNPNTKARICLAIGHDTRVYDTCSTYRGGGGVSISR